MASDAFKKKLLAQARAFHADAVKQGQKKKLQDYIRASSGDATHRQNVANFTKTPDSKIASRNAGQARAQQRLNKLGEGSDMCNVCGQTPCNCTHIEEAKATMCGRCGTKHVPPSKGGTCPALKEAALPKGSMVPGIPSKRDTVVKRAKAKAEIVPVEKAKATYGVGYRQESTSNPYVLEGVVDEAKIPSGLTWTGSELKKRPELVAAAARRKNYQAYLKRKAAKEQNTTKVDESSDKLYAGYQADVLSLKAKAKKQEQERGPVDIQKLAARLKAVKLKGTQK